MGRRDPENDHRQGVAENGYCKGRLLVKYGSIFAAVPETEEALGILILTTRSKSITIKRPMKIILSVILAALFVSIISPLSLTIVPLDTCAYLVAEDVCDAADSSLSVNAEHPVLQPGLCVISCPGCAGCAAGSYKPHIQFVIPARTEHPPEEQLS